MRVNNQTSDPVEYEQNGSGGNENFERNDGCKGTIDSGGHSDFHPCGSPPYRLHIWTDTDPGVGVDIQEITDSKLVVTMSDKVT